MAKLVEILARELKDWPAEAVAIAQDHNGSAHPYNSDDLEFNHGEWGGEKVSALVASYSVTVGGTRAEDYATAIVTRAEWQAAVDALYPKLVVAEEWDGVGLPPVGTVCEYNDNFAWCACDVVAYANGKVVFTRPDYPEAVYVCGCDEVSFRPIRTTEQIAAEERRKGIADIAEDLGNRIWGVTIQEWLYDLGYRKQEPK